MPIFLACPMQLLLDVFMPLSAGMVIPTMIFPRPPLLPCESLVDTWNIRFDISTRMTDWIEELGGNPMAVPRGLHNVTTDNNVRMYMECVRDRVYLPSLAFGPLIRLLESHADNQLPPEQIETWFQPTGIPMDRIARWYYDHLYTPFADTEIALETHFVVRSMVRPRTESLHYWLQAELDKALKPPLMYPMEDFQSIPFNPIGIPRIEQTSTGLEDLPVECISRLAREILNRGGRFFSMRIIALAFLECADDGAVRPREQAARRARSFRNTFSIELSQLKEMTFEALSWYNRFRPHRVVPLNLYLREGRVYPPPNILRRVAESLLNTEVDPLV
jgi:hypothetical protein